MGLAVSVQKVMQVYFFGVGGVQTEEKTEKPAFHRHGNGT
jgi:hypothetical protein